MSSSLNKLFGLFLASLFLLSPIFAEAEVAESDLFVLGATPGGLAAGIAAKRKGLSVTVLEPSKKPGGILSGGLGFSDTCRKEFIGGVALEFFQRIGREFDRELQWNLVPSVAEKVFRDWISEEGLRVLYGETLESAKVVDGNIQAVVSSTGKEFKALNFIDASYTGDLLALAGVDYVIGREGRAAYGESLAGFTERHNREQFPSGLSAYKKDGSLHYGILNKNEIEVGTPDKRVMAYNYRPCLTKQKNNFRKFYQPEDYSSERYSLLSELLKFSQELGLGDILGLNRTVDSKYDLNNKGPFSTNLLNVGLSYSEASSIERLKIEEEHANHIKGLLYFLVNDLSVPPSIREEASRFGYCADEFTASDNFPSQIYIRVGRRMVGEFVLTQEELVSGSRQEDSIGWGSCRIEVHHNQRLVDQEGMVYNEGVVPQVVPPYQIPFRSLIPVQGQADNLLVPVALSASNIAYSSLRMEPQFMTFGQAAGTAAFLSAKYDLSPKEIDAGLLRSHLYQAGAVPGGRYGKYDKLFISIAFGLASLIIGATFS